MLYSIIVLKTHEIRRNRYIIFVSTYIITEAISRATVDNAHNIIGIPMHRCTYALYTVHEPILTRLPGVKYLGRNQNLVQIPDS